MTTEEEREQARERMRRRRAEPEGHAVNLARSRALSRLKLMYPRDFDRLYREEYARALVEERQRAKG